MPFCHAQQTEYGLTENGDFRLFVANRKCKQQTFQLFAANGSGKQKFVFLGRQTINDYRRLLLAKVPIYDDT
jgi:hypothetical protein